MTTLSTRSFSDAEKTLCGRRRRTIRLRSSKVRLDQTAGIKRLPPSKRPRKSRQNSEPTSLYIRLLYHKLLKIRVFLFSFSKGFRNRGL